MNATVIIDEDSFKQIELVPEENYFFINQYLESLKSNRAINGSAPLSRKNFNINKYPVIKCRIDLKKMNSILDKFSYNYFNDVRLGYGEFSTKFEKIAVWGFERYGIFAEYNEDLQITSLWIANSGLFHKSITGDKLFQALAEVGELFNMILIDWDSEILVRINSVDNLRFYLVDNFNFTIN